MEELNLITEKIIGAAIEVHRNLGAGLLESIYQKALAFELEQEELIYEREKKLPIKYKGVILGNLKMDFLVEDKVVVETKSVNKLEAVFEAQLLTYLKLSNKKLGLLINFNVPLLKNGLKRMIL